jgi:hypothetical protein
MDGKYFDFPTAATFETEGDALAYAESFAREQGEARIYGARIVVRTRKGGATVAEYRPEHCMATLTAVRS